MMTRKSTLMSLSLLSLALAACAVDASRDEELVGTVAQRWLTDYTQVGGSFTPDINTNIETFADSTGVHMVGTADSGNRVWYQRTATDGVTVTVPWTQIPGQGLLSFTSWNPTIVRGKRVLRSRDPYFVFRAVSGGYVEYTTLNHYLVGDTWSWTGTWTTVPTIPINTTHITSVYLNGTGRIYVIYSDPTDSQPHITYSNDNCVNWIGPYMIAGGTTSMLTAVDHHTDATNHYIELVKRSDTVPPVLYWNRLLDPAALDFTDWRGWQALPTTITSYQKPSSGVEKTYNFCVYAVELNYSKVWKTCTTYGAGGDSSTFATTWTQLPSTIPSYSSSGTTSYCTSNDSTADVCPNGNSKTFNLISRYLAPSQQWTQIDLK